MIPKQLKESGVKFILVAKKDKNAIEEKWSTEKNYNYDDPILLRHLKRGGNYGVKTGGGLIVIDADSTQLNYLVKTDFPKTFTIETSEDYKRHYYFYCIGLNNTKRLLKNGTKMGDLQSTGAYVVAPNSIHPSGKKYKVVQDLPIAEISADFVNEKLGKFYASEKLKKEVILEGAEEGLRNESMFKLACSFKAKGLNIGEVLQTIKVLNEKNKPPLSENEINQIIKSTFSYKDNQEEEEKPIKSLHAMFKEGIPKINWRVKELIPERGIVILGGTSGSRKTWFGMCLSMCCAVGKTFLGKFETKKCNVLYIDEENGDITIPFRFDLLRKGGIEGDFDNLFISIFNGFKLDNLQDVKELDSLIEKHNAKVVVIDSMVRCMEGEEDKSKDVRKIFDNLKLTLKKFQDVAFVILHHTTKGKVRGINGLRGSGDFPALADVVLMFEEKDIFSNITTEKNRHIAKEEYPKFSIKLEKTENEGLILKHYESNPIQTNEILNCASEIENWYNEEKLETFLSKKVLKEMEKIGFKRNTIYSALNKLLEKKDLRKLKQGVWRVENPFFCTEELVV